MSFIQQSSTFCFLGQSGTVIAIDFNVMWPLIKSLLWENRIMCKRAFMSTCMWQKVLFLLLLCVCVCVCVCVWGEEREREREVCFLDLITLRQWDAARNEDWQMWHGQPIRLHAVCIDQVRSFSFLLPTPTPPPTPTPDRSALMLPRRVLQLVAYMCIVCALVSFPAWTLCDFSLNTVNGMNVNICLMAVDHILSFSRSYYF